MSDLQCPATVLVVRHGESEGNIGRRLSAAAPGSPLTERGREQARALAGRLTQRRVARVYASPLLRAQQTAAELAGALGVDVQPLPGVREFGLGTLEGTDRPSGWAEVDAVFLRWLDGDVDAAVTGGESGREVLERVRDALDGVADLHRGETVVVVSHGGAMALALPRLGLGSRSDVARGRPVPNCGVAELLRDSAGWRLVQWPSGQDAEAHPGDLVDLLGCADAERNRASGGETAQVGGALLARFDLPFAWATQAAFTAQVEPPSSAQVQDAVSWLERRSPGSWHLVVRGEHVEAVVARAGPRLVVAQTHGVWATRQLPLLEAPAGLEIDTARDADEVLQVYGQELEPLVRGRIGVPGDDFLVARSAGRTLACARVRSLAGTAYVSAVTVHPDHRGRGVGRAISAAATAAGLRREPIAWLHCEDDLASLYAGLGYRWIASHVHLAPRP